MATDNSNHKPPAKPKTEGQIIADRRRAGRLSAKKGNQPKVNWVYRRWPMGSKAQ